MENLQKWVEMHNPKPRFAPVQPQLAPVQEAFRSLGPKDLALPLLTTFGNLQFSGPVPEPSDCNTCE